MPAINNVLRREPAPETMDRLVFDTRQTLANSFIKAALALPPSGGAVTLAVRLKFPFASAAILEMRVCPAPGVRRSATLSPRASFVKGEARARLGKIIDERILQGIEQQDQHHRRNIQPPHEG